MAAISQTLNSSSKLRICRQNMMLNFMEIKSNEPKLTQKEISKQLGFADSTSERYSDDNNMDSPYNRQKCEKSDTKRTEIETHTPSQYAKNKKTGNHKKNDLKGGSLLKDRGLKSN